MNRILGFSTANSFSVIFRLFVSLILNKLLSIYLGPSGYAYFSQFTNAFNIGAVFSGGMYAQPASKILSDPDKQQSLEEHHSSIIRFWLIRSVLVTILMIALLLILQQILRLDFINLDLLECFFLFLALVMASFNVLSLGIYSGVERFSTHIITNVTFSVIQLITIWFFIRTLGLNGAIIGFLLAIFFLFFVNIFLQWRSIKGAFKFFAEQTLVAKQMSKLSLLAIISLTSVPLTYFIIRLIAIDQLGVESAGYWQAVWKLSDNYLLIFTSAFSMMLLPFLNKLEDFKEKLFFLRKIIFISLSLLIPFLIIIYIWSEIIILLLFSSEFLHVINFLAFQFIGDFFKVVNIAIGILFLSNSWIKEFIIIELLSFAGFVIFSAFFIITFGEFGIGIAYVINSMLIMGILFKIIHSKYYIRHIF